MIVCMEEELLRAHQRATKDHTPLSVCSVLLENMLLQNMNGGGVVNGCGTGRAAPPSGMTRYLYNIDPPENLDFFPLTFNLSTLYSDIQWTNTLKSGHLV